MKYSVMYTTGASTVVTVEAEDEADALDKADEIFVEPSLCAQCSGWGHGDTNSGVELGEWESAANDAVWELAT